MGNSINKKITKPQEINLSQDLILPYRIRQLIEIIGLDQAYSFLVAHGGTDLDIPQKSSDKYEKYMTNAQLLELVDLFKDNLSRKWYVPKLDKLLVITRDNLIYEYSKTHTLKEVARKYNLTSRCVFSIIHKNPEKIREKIERKIVSDPNSLVMQYTEFLDIKYNQ